MPAQSNEPDALASCQTQSQKVLTVSCHPDLLATKSATHSKVSVGLYMPQFSRRRLQVFVSSTFKDLIPERQAAVEAILAAGHIPAGMELFTSGDESQMDVIRQWIDESDVYMLILGGRYGSVEKKSKKSYTQLEFEYAVGKGTPLFSCVVSPEAQEARIKNAELEARLRSLEMQK